MTTEQIKAASGVVLGVKVDKVEEKRLRTFAKTLGLKVPKGIEAAITSVTERMLEDRKKPDAGEYIACETCDGISSKDLACCPYCGEGGDVDDDEDEKAEATPAGPEEEHGKKSNGLAIVNGKATIVHATPGQDLKRILGQVRGYVRDWTNSAWDIGEQLVLLSQESPERPALWRLLKDPDGVKAKYRTFAAFVKEEIGISDEMARTTLWAVQEYRREQLAGFTLSKLSIVLNAPESQQKKILAAVGTKTAAEIREVVKGANIQEGKKLKAEGKKDPLEKRTAARQERAKRENAAKDAAKGVTTFVLEGSRVTAKLYRENKDADGKLIQASSVTDAWGWIDGKNGVQLVFRLEKNEDGRLKIVFRAKREESEEVER